MVDHDPAEIPAPVDRREAWAGITLLGGLLAALCGVVAYRVLEASTASSPAGSPRGLAAPWTATAEAANVADPETVPAGYVAAEPSSPDAVRRAAGEAPRFVAPGADRDGALPGPPPGGAAQ